MAGFAKGMLMAALCIRAAAEGAVKLQVGVPGPGDEVEDSLGLSIWRRTYYVEVRKEASQDLRNSTLKAQLCGLDDVQFAQSHAQVTAKILNLTSEWHFRSSGSEGVMKHGRMRTCVTLNVNFLASGEHVSNSLIVEYVVQVFSALSYVLTLEPVESMPILPLEEEIKGTLTEKSKHFGLHWSRGYGQLTVAAGATGLHVEQCLGTVGTRTSLKNDESAAIFPHSIFCHFDHPSVANSNAISFSRSLVKNSSVSTPFSVWTRRKIKHKHFLIHPCAKMQK